MAESERIDVSTDGSGAPFALGDAPGGAGDIPAVRINRSRGAAKAAETKRTAAEEKEAKERERERREALASVIQGAHNAAGYIVHPALGDMSRDEADKLAQPLTLCAQEFLHVDLAAEGKSRAALLMAGALIEVESPRLVKMFTEPAPRRTRRERPADVRPGLRVPPQPTNEPQPPLEGQIVDDYTAQ